METLEEKVVPVKAGFKPESVSGADLLQRDHQVCLIFRAMADELNAEGRFEDRGMVIVRFKGCRGTRFGGPNDEGRPEHPLYSKGLSGQGYGFCEVLNSRWASEEMRRSRASAERIWGESFERAYKDHPWPTRHFILSFHESTFECLANDFEPRFVEGPYRKILRRVSLELFED